MIKLITIISFLTANVLSQLGIISAICSRRRETYKYLSLSEAREGKHNKTGYLQLQASGRQGTPCYFSPKMNDTRNK